MMFWMFRSVSPWASPLVPVPAATVTLKAWIEKVPARLTPTPAAEAE